MYQRTASLKTTWGGKMSPQRKCREELAYAATGSAVSSTSASSRVKLNSLCAFYGNFGVEVLKSARLLCNLSCNLRT